MNISTSRPALVLALALSFSFPALARGYFSDQAPLTVPHPTSFSECRQFFPDGRPPVVPQRPALRELCYEAFAVLHSGESKTPVYVSQRLNRKSIEEADERRGDRFFADARLPGAERAGLDDYKRSGYSRGHMRLAVINPQFVSRASASYVIHPFAFDDQWRQLLAAFAQSVQAVDLGIVNTTACRALHMATGGNMRMLKRLLMYACMHAATQPQKIVTLESLSKGLRDAKGDVSEASDPFQRGRS